ncbi:unnamed protein product, partial [Musa acuminata var. zebrina]
VTVSNFLSRGLGADAARFWGSECRGSRAQLPRSLPVGMVAAGNRSGRQLRSNAGKRPPRLRSCTQVGSEARPDPSDDQVRGRDVEGVLEDGMPPYKCGVRVS